MGKIVAAMPRLLLIAAQVIYNEGWAQLREAPWPEGKLVEVVRKLDSTRLINAVSRWNDHGFGDFKVMSEESLRETEN